MSYNLADYFEMTIKRYMHQGCMFLFKKQKQKQTNKTNEKKNQMNSNSIWCYGYPFNLVLDHY